MKKTINVMLVDDHAVVRMGFRMLLEATEDIRVVAEAESAEVAYQQIATTQPDVIVMDISLGGTMGVEATRRIVARDKHARVLGLSSHEDPSYVRYMLKAGALGYLSKRTAPDELIHAIRQVNEGRMYIDSHLSQRMALEEFNGEKSPIEVLSEREFGVFIDIDFFCTRYFWQTGHGHDVTANHHNELRARCQSYFSNVDHVPAGCTAHRGIRAE